MFYSGHIYKARVQSGIVGIGNSRTHGHSASGRNSEGKCGKVNVLAVKVAAQKRMSLKRKNGAEKSAGLHTLEHDPGLVAAVHSQSTATRGICNMESVLGGN